MDKLLCRLIYDCIQVFIILMEKVADLTLKALYRGILKGLKTYPSIKRKELQEAAVLEFREGKELKDEKEIAKGVKKARIAYAHIMLYNMHTESLRGPYKPSRPINCPTFNTVRGLSLIHISEPTRPY
eukprot:TRINITY_DN2631_c0_g1_i5.p1 TRINITY_DN2631_c0_g1~~TRINITY_DN2631_c0_g1_i5.p1  ORF type:complete len:128 (-),score=22.25 TRINITY_DN2631_c0_g1_i5:47-430(-)